MATLKKIKIPVGVLNGRPVHISSVESGLGCSCVCKGCGDRLIAKKGARNQHHFAHASGFCGGGAESNLHSYAKALVEREKRLLLPAIDVFDPERGSEFRWREATEVAFDTAVSEEPLADFQPDLILQKADRSLCVEIAVTHEVGQIKLAKIKKAGVAAIEIRLAPAKLPIDASDRSELDSYILNCANNRHWLYNPKGEQHAAELAERHRKLEEDRCRVREREKEMLRLQAERERKELEARAKKVAGLLDSEFQRRKKFEYARELPGLKQHKSRLKYLGVAGRPLPTVLNQPIAGEFVFACDRRVWQTFIFSTLLFKQFQKRKEVYIKVKTAGNWLRFETDFPLHKELIYVQNLPGFEKAPGLSDVLCGYFEFLAEAGYLDPDPENANGKNHFAGFRVRHASLIDPPPPREVPAIPERQTFRNWSHGFSSKPDLRS